MGVACGAGDGEVEGFAVGLEVGWEFGDAEVEVGWLVGDTGGDGWDVG